MPRWRNVTPRKSRWHANYFDDVAREYLMVMEELGDEGKLGGPTSGGMLGSPPKILEPHVWLPISTDIQDAPGDCND